MAKGLVDGIELASDIYPACKVRESRKHVNGEFCVVDMGDIGLEDDGWTLDTKVGV
jgi:hypothetical protein